MYGQTISYEQETLNKTKHALLDTIALMEKTPGNSLSDQSIK